MKGNWKLPRLAWGFFDILANDVGPLGDYMDVLARQIKEGDVCQSGKRRGKVSAAPVIKEASTYLREMLPQYLRDGGESMRTDLVRKGIIEPLDEPDVPAAYCCDRRDLGYRGTWAKPLPLIRISAWT